MFDKDDRMLTSTSAADGSLLKHMVMVFRAILKKLVKDTDFPCKSHEFKINDQWNLFFPWCMSQEVKWRAIRIKHCISDCVCFYKDLYSLC